MAGDARPVDIGSFPELVHLAEEVRDTNKPRVLRCGNDDIAKLVPLHARAPGRRRRPKTTADHDAFLSSASAWADVDVDAFLRANRQSRDRSTRPAVEL